MGTARRRSVRSRSPVRREPAGDPHLVFAPGARIAGYRIEERLGEGGMGEVFRARDVRLGRDVAIKTLRPDALTHPRRRERFDYEARVLATLNHTNIGAIYDLVEVGDARGLVLELVDGTTLAERLRCGPLSLTETVSIARQITSALCAAHSKGVVHRDLKPANLKITTDGVVKLLDFGIAAPGGADTSGEAPTVTLHENEHGKVTGTAAYMSPEQTRGGAIDKRTDIWAFGCVLFEMLTARRAFGRQTSSDTIAAILDREPDLAGLPTTTPPSLRRLLMRCLEKDPKRRLQDVADAHFDLDEALAEDACASKRSGRRGLGPSGQRWLVAAAITLPILAAAAGRMWLSGASGTETEASRLTPVILSSPSAHTPAPCGH